MGFVTILLPSRFRYSASSYRASKPIVTCGPFAKTSCALQGNIHTRFLTRPVRSDSSGFIGELGISSSRELR